MSWCSVRVTSRGMFGLEVYNISFLRMAEQAQRLFNIGSSKYTSIQLIHSIIKTKASHTSA